MFVRKQEDFARTRHSSQTCNDRSDRNRSHVNKTTTFESHSLKPNQPDQGDEILGQNVLIYSIKIRPRCKFQVLFMAPTSEKLRGGGLQSSRFSTIFWRFSTFSKCRRSKKSFFVIFELILNHNSFFFISFSQCSHWFAPGGNDFSRVRMWAVLDIFSAAGRDAISHF